MKRGWAIGWVVLLGLVGGARADDDSRIMQTYPLYSTGEAAAIVSVAESVLGPAAKVIYDKTNGRLLILATAGEHEKVKEVLAPVNVPPANVRITVAMEESAQQELTSIGVAGNASVVLEGEAPKVTAELEPKLANRSGRRSRNNKQELLVQSGGEASLKVGEEVPYADWMVQYGLSQGYLAQAVTLREVGAVLRVQARVIGDGPLISLKLTPELTGRSEQGDQAIAFTRLATDVTVEDGQTLDVGGLTANVEFYNKFLIGLDRGGNRRALTLKVTPRIERPRVKPAPAAAAATAQP